MKIFNWRVSSEYLDAHAQVLVVYREAERFSAFVTKLYLEQQDTSRPLSRGALFKLMVETVSLHRAILSLCHEGWASKAQIFLRTLIDNAINTTAIIHNKDTAELMAFRYYYFSHKQLMNDQTVARAEREGLKERAVKAIDLLPEKHKQPAKDFLFSEPTRAYWYSPTFAGPKQILEQYSNNDMIKMYDHYSGATHGGFIASSTFKDSPDDHHPDPRKDKYSQNFVLMGTSRQLIEIANLQGQFFELAIEGVYVEVMTNFLKLQGIPVTKKMADDLLASQ